MNTDDREVETVIINAGVEDKKKYLIDQFCFMSCGIVLFILMLWIFSNLPIVGPFVNSTIQSVVMNVAIMTGTIVPEQNQENYV